MGVWFVRKRRPLHKADVSEALTLAGDFSEQSSDMACTVLHSSSTSYPDKKSTEEVMTIVLFSILRLIISTWVSISSLTPFRFQSGLLALVLPVVGPGLPSLR